MNAKEYLKGYGRLEAERLNLLDERNALVEEIALPSGIAYDADKVQSSPTQDNVYNLYLRIQSRTKFIDGRLRAIDRDMDTIKDQINALDDNRYVRLLYLRYVEGLPLDQVAKQMSYDYDWIRKLHGYALLSFAHKNTH